MKFSVSSDSAVLDAAAEIAVRDIAGNIHPYHGGLLKEARPCLIAGAGYESPWTRDAAYNCFYGFPLLEPTVARDTLLSVLTEDRHGLRIGGEYWDAMIWASGAWTYYLASGDTHFLGTAYEATRNSLSFFEASEFDSEKGLFRGPATFSDGVSGYPDRYVSPDMSSGISAWVEHFPDKAAPEGVGLPMMALSTNVIYYRAYTVARLMANELRVDEPAGYASKAEDLRRAIHEHFWMHEERRFRYLVDQNGGCNGQEGWGHALALLCDVTDERQAESIFDHVDRTPHGLPCLWPAYERYRKPAAIRPYENGVHPNMFIEGLREEDLRPDLPPYGRHCGTVWPQINASWALACWKHGRRQEALKEMEMLAEKAVRDGNFREMYHPETGEPYGGLQEFDRAASLIRWPSAMHQTWCATGFTALVVGMLCGMEMTPAGVGFKPYLPDGVDHLRVCNLIYRGHAVSLNITRARGEKAAQARMLVPTGISEDVELNLHTGSEGTDR